MKILLIEDDVVMIQLLSAALRERGHDPVTRLNAESAWKTYQDEVFPIIILDLILPDFDGVKLLKQMRNSPGGYQSVVLVCTVRREPEALKEILEAGADDYIAKPFDLELFKIRLAIAEQRARHLVARAQTEQALRDSEERYRTLVELCPDGLLVHRNGKIVLVNTAAAQILGATDSAQLIGMQLLDLVHPDDLEAVRKRLAQLNAGNSVPVAERKLLRLDGSSVSMEMAAAPFIFDGKPAVQMIMRNVAERRELEAQLYHAQKMEAIGQLAGGIAHDFNNLLQVITGYSELLLQRLPGKEPLRKQVEMINRSAERATTLTRQLLAFGRRQVMQPKVLNLNVIIRDMEKMLRRMIGEDIELITHLDTDLWPVKVDPGQIEQVIMNLAVNSRDAMPRGGKLIIETRDTIVDEDYASTHVPAMPGDYVVLIVSDTGTGMDKEARVRCFEPFFTTKPQGKGTGLGLSTVYGRVKQSDGYIWVYSEVNKGTTFKIYLPRAMDSVSEPRRTAANSTFRTGTETIVVAEDEGDVRQLVLTTLRSLGYNAIEAVDSAAAIQICKEYKGTIDMLLTDVVMPQMSGRELSLRLQEIRPALKVLYMSGYTDDAIVHHGILDPGLAFIEKPFSKENLAIKVRTLLDTK